MGANTSSHFVSDRRKLKETINDRFHSYHPDEDLNNRSFLSAGQSLPSLATNSTAIEHSRPFVRPLPRSYDIEREEIYVNLNDLWKANTSNPDISLNSVAKKGNTRDHLYLWQEKLMKKQKSHQAKNPHATRDEFIYGSLDRCMPKKTRSNYDNYLVVTGNDVARTSGYSYIRSPSYEDPPDTIPSARVPMRRHDYDMPPEEESRVQPQINSSGLQNRAINKHSMDWHDYDLQRVERLQTDLLDSEARKKSLWVELQTLLSQRRLMQNSLEFLLSNRSDLLAYANGLSLKIGEVHKEVQQKSSVTIDYCDKCCTRF